MTAHFRVLEETDLGAVFALTRKAGLNRERAEADWCTRARWLFFDSRHLVQDAVPPPPGLIAEIDGEMAGFVGYSYRRFRRGGKEFNAVVLNDYAVHPKRRGVLGLELNQHTIAAFQSRGAPYVILGLHHTREAALIWARHGAGPVRDSNATYTGLVSAANAIASRTGLAPRLARLAAPIARMRGHREIQRRPLPDGVRLAWLSRLDEAAGLDGLLAGFGRSHAAGVSRTRDYLAWRYEAHPKAAYRFLAIRAEDGLAGLLVLGHGAKGAGYVMEAIHGPDLPGGAETMVDAMVQASAQAGIGHLLAKSTSTGLARVMRARGFVRESKAHDQFWVYPEALVADDSIYTYGDFKDD